MPSYFNYMDPLHFISSPGRGGVVYVLVLGLHSLCNDLFDLARFEIA
jgi:hypothetical protein